MDDASAQEIIRTEAPPQVIETLDFGEVDAPPPMPSPATMMMQHYQQQQAAAATSARGGAPSTAAIPPLASSSSSRFATPSASLSSGAPAVAAIAPTNPLVAPRGQATVASSVKASAATVPAASPSLPSANASTANNTILPILRSGGSGGSAHQSNSNGSSSAMPTANVAASAAAAAASSSIASSSTAQAPPMTRRVSVQFTTTNTSESGSKATAAAHHQPHASSSSSSAANAVLRSTINNTGDEQQQKQNYSLTSPFRAGEVRGAGNGIADVDALNGRNGDGDEGIIMTNTNHLAFLDDPSRFEIRKLNEKQSMRLTRRALKLLRRQEARQGATGNKMKSLSSRRRRDGNNNNVGGNDDGEYSDAEGDEEDDNISDTTSNGTDGDHSSQESLLTDYTDDTDSDDNSDQLDMKNPAVNMQYPASLVRKNTIQSLAVMLRGPASIPVGVEGVDEDGNVIAEEDMDAEEIEIRRKKVVTMPLSAMRKSRRNWLYQVPLRAASLESTSFFVIPPFNDYRILLFNLLSHRYFETFLFLVIMANCIFIATEKPRSSFVDKPAYQFFTEYIFAIFFSVEMLLKLFVHGAILHKKAYFRSPMNCLDAMVVGFAWAAVLAELFGNYTPFRILRLFKCVKSMHFGKPMSLVLSTVQKSILPLCGIVLATFFAVWFFALIGVQLWMGDFSKRCFHSGTSAMLDTRGCSSNGLAEKYDGASQSIYWGRFCPPDYTCRRIEDVFPDPNSLENRNLQLYHGYLTFDTLGGALLAVFNVFSFDHWGSMIADRTFDVMSMFTFFYFLAIICTIAYCVPALSIAVVISKFREASDHYDEKQLETFESIKRDHMLTHALRRRVPRPVYAMLRKGNGDGEQWQQPSPSNSPSRRRQQQKQLPAARNTEEQDQQQREVAPFVPPTTPFRGAARANNNVNSNAALTTTKTTEEVAKRGDEGEDDNGDNDDGRNTNGPIRPRTTATRAEGNVIDDPRYPAAPQRPVSATLSQGGAGFVSPHITRNAHGSIVALALENPTDVNFGDDDEGSEQQNGNKNAANNDANTNTAGKKKRIPRTLPSSSSTSSPRQADAPSSARRKMNAAAPIPRPPNRTTTNGNMVVGGDNAIHNGDDHDTAANNNIINTRSKTQTVTISKADTKLPLNERQAQRAEERRRKALFAKQSSFIPSRVSKLLSIEQNLQLRVAFQEYLGTVRDSVLEAEAKVLPDAHEAGNVAYKSRVIGGDVGPHTFAGTNAVASINNRMALLKTQTIGIRDVNNGGTLAAMRTMNNPLATMGESGGGGGPTMGASNAIFASRPNTTNNNYDGLNRATPIGSARNSRATTPRREDSPSRVGRSGSVFGRSASITGLTGTTAVGGGGLQRTVSLGGATTATAADDFNRMTMGGVNANTAILANNNSNNQCATMNKSSRSLRSTFTIARSGTANNSRASSRGGVIGGGGGGGAGTISAIPGGMRAASARSRPVSAATTFTNSQGGGGETTTARAVGGPMVNRNVAATAVSAEGEGNAVTNAENNTADNNDQHNQKVDNNPHAILVQDPEGGDIISALKRKEEEGIMAALEEIWDVIRNTVHAFTEGYPRVISLFILAQRKVDAMERIPAEFQPTALRALLKRRAYATGGTDRRGFDRAAAASEKGDRKRNNNTNPSPSSSSSYFDSLLDDDDDHLEMTPLEVAVRIRDTARPTWFSYFVNFIVLVDIAFLGAKYAGMGDDLFKAVDVISFVCNTIFAFELFLRLVGLGFTLWFSDWMNIFDLQVIVFAFIEFGLNGTISVSAFRALRVLRMGALFPYGPLQHICRVYLRVVPFLSSIMALLILFVFMTVLIGMQILYGKYDNIDHLVVSPWLIPRDNFDSFLNAVYAVIQTITRDSWTVLSYNSMSVTTWGMAFFFIAIVLIGNLLIIPLFIAAFVHVFETDEFGDGSPNTIGLMLVETRHEYYTYMHTVNAKKEIEASRYAEEKDLFYNRAATNNNERSDPRAANNNAVKNGVVKSSNNKNKNGSPSLVSRTRPASAAAAGVSTEAMVAEATATTTIVPLPPTSYDHDPANRLTTIRYNTAITNPSTFIYVTRPMQQRINASKREAELYLEERARRANGLLDAVLNDDGGEVYGNTLFATRTQQQLQRRNTNASLLGGGASSSAYGGSRAATPAFTTTLYRSLGLTAMSNNNNGGRQQSLLPSTTALAAMRSTAMNANATNTRGGGGGLFSLTATSNNNRRRSLSATTNNRIFTGTVTSRVAAEGDAVLFPPMEVEGDTVEMGYMESGALLRHQRGGAHGVRASDLREEYEKKKNGGADDGDFVFLAPALPAPAGRPQRTPQEVRAAHLEAIKVRKAKQKVLSEIRRFVDAQTIAAVEPTRALLSDALAQLWSAGMLLAVSLEEVLEPSPLTGRVSWDLFVEELEDAQAVLDLQVGEEQVGRGGNAIIIGALANGRVINNRNLTWLDRSLFLFAPNNGFRVFITDKILETLWFEILSFALVIASCVILASYNPRYAHDPHSDEGERRENVLNGFDDFFTIVFTIEVALRIISQGFIIGTSRKPFITNAFMASGWNIIDLVVALMSILSWAAHVAVFVRYIKAIRLFRVLRIASLFEQMRDLRVISLTILRAIPALIIVCVILCFNYLIWGVMGVAGNMEQMHYCTNPAVTQWGACRGLFNQTIMVDDGTSGGSMIAVRREVEAEWLPLPRNFDNSGNAMLNMMEVSTGEWWVELANQAIDATGRGSTATRDYTPFKGLFFVAFIIVTNFAMLRILAGVMLYNYNIVRRQADSAYLMTRPQRDWCNAQRILLGIQPIKLLKPLDNFISKFVFKWLLNRSSIYFHLAVLFVIFWNEVFISLDHWNMDSTYQSVSENSNFVFVAIYWAIMLLELTAYGPKYYFFGTAGGYGGFGLWHWFDAILNILVMVEIIVSQTKDGVAVGKGIGINFNIFRMVKLAQIVSLSKDLGSRRGFWTRQFNSVRILTLAMFYSIKGLFALGCLLLFFFVSFAIIGVHAFAMVNSGITINETSYPNFNNFPNALIFLFRLVGNEDWNRAMHDAMQSTSEPNNCHDTHGHNCGSSVAPLFFVPLVFLFAFVFVYLSVCIILENYEAVSFIEGRSKESTLANMREFIERWQKYDPNATGLIKTDLLPFLLQDLKPHRGVARITDREEVLKKVAEYSIPDHNGKVHFTEVMIPILRASTGIRFTPNQLKLQQESWRRYAAHLKHLPITRLRDCVCTAEQFLAASYARSVFSRRLGRLYGKRLLRQRHESGLKECHDRNLDPSEYGYNGKRFGSGPTFGDNANNNVLNDPNFLPAHVSAFTERAVEYYRARIEKRRPAHIPVDHAEELLASMGMSLTATQNQNQQQQQSATLGGGTSPVRNPLVTRRQAEVEELIRIGRRPPQQLLVEAGLKKKPMTTNVFVEEDNEEEDVFHHAAVLVGEPDEMRDMPITIESKLRQKALKRENPRRASQFVIAAQQVLQQQQHLHGGADNMPSSSRSVNEYLATLRGGDVVGGIGGDEVDERGRSIARMFVDYENRTELSPEDAVSPSTAFRARRKNRAIRYPPKEDGEDGTAMDGGGGVEGGIRRATLADVANALLNDGGSGDSDDDEDRDGDAVERLTMIEAAYKAQLAEAIAKSEAHNASKSKRAPHQPQQQQQHHRRAKADEEDGAFVQVPNEDQAADQAHADQSYSLPTAAAEDEDDNEVPLPLRSASITIGGGGGAAADRQQQLAALLMQSEKHVMQFPAKYTSATSMSAKKFGPEVPNAIRRDLKQEAKLKRDEMLRTLKKQHGAQVPVNQNIPFGSDISSYEAVVAATTTPAFEWGKLEAFKKAQQNQQRGEIRTQPR